MRLAGVVQRNDHYGDAGGTLKAFSVMNAKFSTAPTSQCTISFA
jgi:hypothetical protein